MSRHRKETGSAGSSYSIRNPTGTPSAWMARYHAFGSNSASAKEIAFGATKALLVGGDGQPADGANGLARHLDQRDVGALGHRPR